MYALFSSLPRGMDLFQTNSEEILRIKDSSYNMTTNHQELALVS